MFELVVNFSFVHLSSSLQPLELCSYSYLQLIVGSDITLPKDEMILLRQVLTSPFFKSVKEVMLKTYVV